MASCGTKVIHLCIILDCQVVSDAISTQCAQESARPARACTLGSVSYCDFLFSDDEGSDLDEDVQEDCPNEDEEYDPSKKTDAFDKKRGDNNWIGRRVVKNFGSAGDFEGVVYGVDEDEARKDYRLFLVYYFDDEDAETMWPEELDRYGLAYLSNM